MKGYTVRKTCFDDLKYLRDERALNWVLDTVGMCWTAAVEQSNGSLTADNLFDACDAVTTPWDVMAVALRLDWGTVLISDLPLIYKALIFGTGSEELRTKIYNRVLGKRDISIHVNPETMWMLVLRNVVLEKCTVVGGLKVCDLY